MWGFCFCTNWIGKGVFFFSVAVAPLLNIRSWTTSITTAPYHPIFVRLSRSIHFLLSPRPFPGLDQCICVIKILPVRARVLRPRTPPSIPTSTDCRLKSVGGAREISSDRIGTAYNILYYILCLPSYNNYLLIILFRFVVFVLTFNSSLIVQNVLAKTS